MRPHLQARRPAKYIPTSNAVAIGAPGLLPEPRILEDNAAQSYPAPLCPYPCGTLALAEGVPVISTPRAFRLPGSTLTTNLKSSACAPSLRLAGALSNMVLRDVRITQWRDSRGPGRGRGGRSGGVRGGGRNARRRRGERTRRGCGRRSRRRPN